jgi:hypothetical protein
MDIVEDNTILQWQCTHRAVWSKGPCHVCHMIKNIVVLPIWCMSARHRRPLRIPKLHEVVVPCFVQPSSASQPFAAFWSSQIISCLRSLGNHTIDTILPLCTYNIERMAAPSSTPGSRFLKWLMVPIILSCVIALNKHWLLKVPNVGFILYKVAGGNIPAVSVFLGGRDRLRTHIMQ